jgi:hypothetical protein
MSQEKIHAPFTPEQVQALNDYQFDGVMHPYTCGGEHRTHVRLIARRDGWHCPVDTCSYRQFWALAFTAEPLPSVKAPVRLPIGVTPPVTVNDQAELARVVYLALTSLVDFAATPFASEASARRQTNAIVEALLSGKTSAQLASEATNGQEGGEAHTYVPDREDEDSESRAAADPDEDEGDGPWRYDVDARHDFYDPMGEDR